MTAIDHDVMMSVVMIILFLVSAASLCKTPLTIVYSKPLACEHSYEYTNAGDLYCAHAYTFESFHLSHICNQVAWYTNI